MKQFVGQGGAEMWKLLQIKNFKAMLFGIYRHWQYVGNNHIILKVYLAKLSKEK